MSALSRENRVLGILAGTYFGLLWLPSFVGLYGYFIDELYYFACAQRLDWGYVDHPPLSIALLWIVRSGLGDSLPALRLVPALAGATTIFVTGLMARRLGAGVYGQALAAGALAVGGLPLVMFGFFSMNALAILIWALCFWILIEIEKRDEPRLWLLFGAVAGLGALNKHTIVLLAIGLAAGLVLTPARRHLASPWLWLGAALAIVVVSPNLLWEQAHHWISLEFYRNADRFKNVPTPPLEVLKQQLLFMNPPAAVVWVGGVVFFLFRESGRRYRHLGIAFLTLFVLMVVSQKSRPDRIVAAYSVVMAGGGALLGEVLGRPGLRRWRAALPVAIAAGGLVFAPIGIPVFPPDLTARYGSALGIVPQVERGAGKRTALPQWLADRLAWPEFVADTERVVRTLSEDERRDAIIVAPSYGQAGALQLLGHELPPVYSGHNNYYLWGPPDEMARVAVIVGWRREDVEANFRSVDGAGEHECEACTPWRNGMPFWIVRQPRRSWAALWPDVRHLE